jgi:MinD-like ATPase involved in chromosome partitioning or flagellar assembly
MSTIAFFSAKGAPGVTTTAMLTASLWPRPALLADCDPAGGDMGLRLPRPDGRPLDLGTGLLSLLPLARRELSPGTVRQHAQPVLGGGEVVVGVTGPEQATAVGPVWATLAQALADLDEQDVIIDLGRLDPTSPVLPLADSADLLVCVLDGSVPGVFAARARLRTLLPALPAATGGAGLGPKVGIVVHAEDRRDAVSGAGVIRSDCPEVADLGWLANDPVGARIFDGQPVNRPERTMLVRSGRELVGRLHSAIGVPQWSPQQTGGAPAGGTESTGSTQPATEPNGVQTVSAGEVAATADPDSRPTRSDRHARRRAAGGRFRGSVAGARDSGRQP